MVSRALLRSARDQFAALLRKDGSLECEWQKLFAEHPFILSESLPLRLRPSQIVSRGRPGRSEADFLLYPDRDIVLPSTYGVVELKRPSTPILSIPRRQVIKLSADAETAYAQAKLYASQLARELYSVPNRLLAVGGSTHIFLIVGSSDEIRAKVISDIERQQLDGLLPAGVELLPFDTLFKLFQKRVPPQLHVVVPSPMPLGSDTSAATTFRQLTPVFIFHARPAAVFAAELTSGLEHAGIRVWNYQRDLSGGGDIQALLRDAIERASALVVVLSQPASWHDAVSLELERAVGKQSVLGRETLIPLALDSSWRDSPLAETLRGYEVLDFTRWRSAASFLKQFALLVQALRAVAA